MHGGVGCPLSPSRDDRLLASPPPPPGIRDCWGLPPPGLCLEQAGRLPLGAEVIWVPVGSRPCVGRTAEQDAQDARRDNIHSARPGRRGGTEGDGGRQGGRAHRQLLLRATGLSPPPAFQTPSCPHSSPPQTTGSTFLSLVLCREGGCGASQGPAGGRKGAWGYGFLSRGSCRAWCQWRGQASKLWGSPKTLPPQSPAGRSRGGRRRAPESPSFSLLLCAEQAQGEGNRRVNHRDPPPSQKHIQNDHLGNPSKAGNTWGVPSPGLFLKRAKGMSGFLTTALQGLWGSSCLTRTEWGGESRSCTRGPVGHESPSPPQTSRKVGRMEGRAEKPSQAGSALRGQQQSALKEEGAPSQHVPRP